MSECKSVKIEWLIEERELLKGTKIINEWTKKEAMLVEVWLFKQRKSVCSSKM